MPSPTLEHLLHDSSWKRRVQRRLLAWYATHARVLPWRSSRDPYRVWISEIMLQQTQVATVQGYYARFLERFPTVESLAEAPEEEVLRFWEGLGYYRRARQLHQAARVVAEQYGGQFPRTAGALERLPGIGRYTAGAIVSIAFDQPAAILEANSARLLARLAAWRQPLAHTASRRALWQLSESLLPPRQAGRWNQALMDLGSLVCRPRAPDCHQCPLASLCAARAGGLEDAIPVAAPRRPAEVLHEAAVVVRCRDLVLLRRCAPGERWAGLWDFLRFPLPTDSDADTAGSVLRTASEQTGRPLRLVQPLGTIQHGVTRYRITLRCYLASLPPPAGEVAAPLQWHPLARLPELPLSSTGRRISRALPAAAPS